MADSKKALPLKRGEGSPLKRQIGAPVKRAEAQNASEDNDAEVNKGKGFDDETPGRGATLASISTGEDMQEGIPTQGQGDILFEAVAPMRIAVLRQQVKGAKK